MRCYELTAYKMHEVHAKKLQLHITPVMLKPPVMMLEWGGGCVPCDLHGGVRLLTSLMRWQHET